jgi:hypothetical protein
LALSFEFDETEEIKITSSAKPMVEFQTASGVLIGDGFLSVSYTRVRIGIQK